MADTGGAIIYCNNTAAALSVEEAEIREREDSDTMTGEWADLKVSQVIILPRFYMEIYEILKF